jgi:hypothetical protein
VTAYRGVGELTALTLSSGQITRRGHITKAGPQGVRTALVEGGLALPAHRKVGVGLARRHSDLSAGTIAWSPTAQRRLNTKFRQMLGHGKVPSSCQEVIWRLCKPSKKSSSIAI